MAEFIRRFGEGLGESGIYAGSDDNRREKDGFLHFILSLTQ